MQSVSSRIWTCVTVSISNGDNHYTTGTSNLWIYAHRKIACIELTVVGDFNLTYFIFLIKIP